MGMSGRRVWDGRTKGSFSAAYIWYFLKCLFPTPCWLDRIRSRAWTFSLWVRNQAAVHYLEQRTPLWSPGKTYSLENLEWARKMQWPPERSVHLEVDVSTNTTDQNPDAVYQWKGKLIASQLKLCSRSPGYQQRLRRTRLHRQSVPSH